MAKSGRTLAEVTVVGPDKKGVVAGLTNFIFESRGNIEKINQNVIGGLFGMQLEASFQREGLDEESFRRGLSALGRKLAMEIKLHLDESTRPKNMALFVTKEPHCLAMILEAKRRGNLKANISLVVGSENSLEPLAKKFRVPFVSVDHKNQPEAEKKLIQLSEKYNVDFIVLARYMRILSPNFVWRFPNRIINIHPSLLPAFSGAYAYVQAFERGAQIVGCTAHFVTEELDQGPIICQESFRVNPKDQLEDIKRRGKDLEALTLLNAVKLFTEKRLEVYWGKVHTKN